MEIKMELEEILALIDHVSAAGLRSFCYETEDLKLSIKGGTPTAMSVENGGLQPVMQDVGETVMQTVQPSVPEGRIVTSPLVGTFYAAPSEDAEPFVRVGDSVKKGQVMAIVEAMKLMNEIESDYDGIVTDILVQDGEPVEYGQPLFCIK